MTGGEFREMMECNNSLFITRVPAFVIAPDHTNINSEYISSTVNYISLTVVKSEYYKDSAGRSDILIKISHRTTPYCSTTPTYINLLSKLTSYALINLLGIGFNSYYQVIENDREFTPHSKSEVLEQLNKYNKWKKIRMREDNLYELLINEK